MRGMGLVHRLEVALSYLFATYVSRELDVVGRLKESLLGWSFLLLMRGLVLHRARKELRPSHPRIYRKW